MELKWSILSLVAEPYEYNTLFLYHYYYLLFIFVGSWLYWWLKSRWKWSWDSSGRSDKSYYSVVLLHCSIILSRNCYWGQLWSCQESHGYVLLCVCWMIMDQDHLCMFYYELTMSIASWLSICSGVVSGVDYAANDHTNNLAESINYYYLIYHKKRVAPKGQSLHRSASLQIQLYNTNNYI